MIVLDRKLALVATVALGLMAIVGCGSDSAEEATSTTIKRPSADPPLYHQTEYDATSSWNQGISDQRVGTYRESAWHDPAGYRTEVIIDSRPSEGAPSPMAAAELARVQANWLPHYKERVFKKVMLTRHQPAIKFAYDAAGESRIVYFFQRCGTSFSVRGSAYTPSYQSYAETYRYVATHIKAMCS